MKLRAALNPRRAIAVLGVSALASVAFAVTPSSGATNTSEGIMCETDAHNTFSVTAKDGYVTTPDGNSIYMWSYAMSGADFQLPGPTLCVTEGQHVTVILHNTLPEPTSILFPGQLGVTADGNPAQPQLAPGAMTSMVQAADTPPGPDPDTVTYEFTAGTPGTYLYSSGTDVDKQFQMGLYGALVVRPAGHPDQVNTRADSAFNPQHEYLFVLSEIDPDLHLAVERDEPFDMTAYNARYFLINGRSMPDTLAPNNAAWLPSQPYGGMVHIKPYDASSNPLPALIRYLNAGSVNYPFHPHGSDERVVNTDGHPTSGTDGADQSYLKFDLDVQPGQSVDALMDWRDVENWNAATNPLPVNLPALPDQMLPGTDTWFNESGYLGVKGTLPGGKTDNNECGEYYHIAHSHALEQATNYGAAFGGMMTVFRIDPPSGCTTN
jgi:FtsP/CotA-like multicopper oxidase with cupredoxin domain